MPFIEKVDRIAQGRYPVTAFVRKYQHKLKYFGDLRNQVVHGFRLEQHHYLLASDYAVKQIKNIYEHLTKPPTVHDCCLKDIPVVLLDMPLREVIVLLTELDLSALPIRDATGLYHDTIFLKEIVAASLLPDFLIHPVQQFLTDSSCQALFMPSDASVYEIESLFSTTREEGKQNEVVWITAT